MTEPNIGGQPPPFPPPPALFQERFFELFAGIGGDQDPISSNSRNQAYLESQFPSSPQESPEVTAHRLRVLEDPELLTGLAEARVRADRVLRAMGHEGLWAALD